MATLFFYGGPAVHGFTINLMVGIVAGTLLAISVASPILPWLGVAKQDLMPETKPVRQVLQLSCPPSCSRS
jgi:preprotein translocase subunit SecF